MTHTEGAVRAGLSAPVRRLPAFPWDVLAPSAARARAHPGGIVDLSVGTPVDPVPAVVQGALAGATDTPGYPAAAGTPALREAVAGWLRRVHGVHSGPDDVVPTIGSKELVAALPTQLGVPAGARVLHPELAYPTYDVGARLAGARPEPAGSPPVNPSGVALVWLNSPSNPTGRVLGAPELRAWVEWGRAHGVPVVNDECYLDLCWDGAAPSILHPDVCGADHRGVLAVHSLSKRSSIAGYRAGFVAGDPRLVADLRDYRKHAGLLVPRPVQAAMVAALGDEAHVEEQRQRYAGRRALLRGAFEKAGFAVEHSEAGLYLWLTRDEDCWDSVGWLAERGILVVPGVFYGTAGHRHVRAALTVTDERVAAAVTRLN